MTLDWPPPREVRHGTYTAYNDDRCRCDLCRSANARRQRADDLRRADALADGAQIDHGASAYTNWLCRCDICSEANRAKCVAYRARAS